MDLTEKISRIRLIRTRNVGPMTYGLLMQRYGSAIAAIEAIPDLAKRVGRQLKPASIDLAKDELAHNQAAGATMLFRGGDGYPARLGQFDDAPPVISVKGNANLLNRPLVAIVGARNASINALRHAESLASELSQNGYVIVSGLARGIDGAAHNGALNGGTIAVIAGGIDNYYPPENEKLQHAIEESGLIIAEMPPTTQPTPHHFPIRNRINAGLSLGVVVIEAAARSGSLITAREASERGSEVMAIPGSPLDPRAEGCNNLIREGATLVTNTADILECLSRPLKATLPPPTDWSAPAPDPGSSSDVEDCRRIIIEGLSTSSTDIDQIVRWCNAPTATVQAAILELELAGLVSRHHGNRVAKIVQL